MNTAPASPSHIVMLRDDADNGIRKDQPMLRIDSENGTRKNRDDVETMDQVFGGTGDAPPWPDDALLEDAPNTGNGGKP